MIKNKIVLKLAFGFTISTIFSLIIVGLLFINMFSDNYIKDKSELMIKDAKLIADIENKSEILSILDYFTDTRVWIIDSNGNLITRSVGLYCKDEGTCDCLLPNNDNELINKVLSGEEVISKNNTHFYDTAMLSVGVPIYDENKNISGAVLMHASIKNLATPIEQVGNYLLISIVLSTIFASFIAWIYSLYFTKNLRKLKNVTEDLTNGDYSVRANIKSKDEIGNLGNSIDILANRLKRAKEESDKLDTMRRDFVANVSHEFRTPLTVIKGKTELMLQNNEVDKEKYCNTILKETESLERMITDLLDLSRIEEGKLELSFESVDVNSIISDAIRTINPIAQDKNISITSKINDNVPMIKTDYFRLKQVIVIFLHNACKYSDNFKQININVFIDDNFNIEISDQGYGIEEKHLPYIWDRFFKVDKNRTDKDSMGLGLSIARSLINILGGNVSIKSVVKKGTQINICLPLNENNE